MSATGIILSSFTALSLHGAIVLAGPPVLPPSPTGSVAANGAAQAEPVAPASSAALAETPATAATPPRVQAVSHPAPAAPAPAMSAPATAETPVMQSAGASPISPDTTAPQVTTPPRSPVAPQATVSNIQSSHTATGGQSTTAPRMRTTSAVAGRTTARPSELPQAKPTSSSPAPAAADPTRASRVDDASASRHRKTAEVPVDDDRSGGRDDALADAVDNDPSVSKQGKQGKKFKHSGFVMTADVGTLGCTRAICSGGSRLNSDPGVRVGGFLGGNIGGFIELGVTGGWGKTNPQGVDGRNLLDVYGIDTAQARMLADELDFDVDTLQINSAESSTINGGLGLRIHFIPRGRVTAYAGSGFSYSLYRTSYGTQSGTARLDFHGYSIPIEGGMAVYVLPRLAIAAQFDYLWTDFVAMHGVLPEQQAVAPVGTLDKELDKMGDGFEDDLPHFWTATVGLRLTL